jgi:hypothetical protein
MRDSLKYGKFIYLKMSQLPATQHRGLSVSVQDLKEMVTDA